MENTTLEDAYNLYLYYRRQGLAKEQSIIKAAIPIDKKYYLSNGSISLRWESAINEIEKRLKKVKDWNKIMFN